MKSRNGREYFEAIYVDLFYLPLCKLFKIRPN